VIARAVNALLHRAGVKLVRTRTSRPWDAEFLRWITEAKAAGVDPNDVGDRVWQGNAHEGASRHLFPRITPESVVLELGPGSGRYTRHVLPRCREMILVDYSRAVCDWLNEYLPGKGRFTVIPIDRPVLAGVADGIVDFVFANGVFEHIDPDETDFFMQEFHRVLKPGGRLWFNFDNFMSPGGSRWFLDERVSPGGRRLFRYYHPDLLQRIVEMRGFAGVTVAVGDSRFGYLDAMKPPAAV
jgi:SAM-dependent methyltransferase